MLEVRKLKPVLRRASAFVETNVRDYQLPSTKLDKSYSATTMLAVGAVDLTLRAPCIAASLLL